MVVRSRNRNPWILSTIYASSNPNIHLEFWRYIIELGRVIALLLLLVGDFNQILHSDEKKGGQVVQQASLRPFRKVVTCCDLIDLGFSGPRFTWTNMRWVLLMCKSIWIELSVVVSSCHPTRSRPDHNLVLICNGQVGRDRIIRPFRVKMAWFSHPKFEEVVA